MLAYLDINIYLGRKQCDLKVWYTKSIHQQCDLFLSLSLAPDCVYYNFTLHFLPLSLAPDCVYYNFTLREEEDCCCQQPSSGQVLIFASPCDAMMSPVMQAFQRHCPHL